MQARHALALTLALALTACQFGGPRLPTGPADVKLRALAADDAETAFDPLELGLPDIWAVAALPGGAALLATDGGLWRYDADGQGKLLTPEKPRYAALVPDGTGKFLAFNRFERNRTLPAAIHRVDADGKAELVVDFGEGYLVRAVAPAAEGAVRALVMGVGGGSATVWEAKAGAEPTKLRELSSDDAYALGLPTDEQATGVDAEGRFVLATGIRRYVEAVTITVGVLPGQAATAADPGHPVPTALAVRLDPFDGGPEALDVEGHRVSVDGQGNLFGLDSGNGTLHVRPGDDAEPRVMLSVVPETTFPRQPGEELAFRAALGADGEAFLAPELETKGTDGLKKMAMAPKATVLMRVAGGGATRVLGAVGGQQGAPKPGNFDLIEPAAGAPYFMTKVAIGLDGRIALAEVDHRIIRVVQAGKGIKTYTWPEKHRVSALALGSDGSPWIAYEDNRDIPAPFPGNLLGGKDYDFNVYLGKLNADGTIERKATLVQTKYMGEFIIDYLVVRPNGTAFALRVETVDRPRPELIHVAANGDVKSLWQMGEGRASDHVGNYNTPDCSLGLARDGAVEVVAGTQHARVAAGKTTATDMPDLPVNGAYPAVDPAGNLHVRTALEGSTYIPTLTRVGADGSKSDVLAGLFSAASLDYRLGSIDATGFDAKGNLYMVDRRQQRLFRVPANRLPN